MEHRLLLGSRNPARLALTRSALAGLPVRVVTLDEVGVTAEAPEEGVTAAENAASKARFYAAASGLLTLAMDGALWIEKVRAEDQPGVMVRRVGDGEGPRSDAGLTAHYARLLAAVGGESRAVWSAGYALAGGPGPEIVESFTFVVRMVAEPVGEPEPGHPLDPLMRDPASGRPYTEIPDRERPYFGMIRSIVLRGICV